MNIQQYNTNLKSTTKAHPHTFSSGLLFFKTFAPSKMKTEVTKANKSYTDNFPHVNHSSFSDPALIKHTTKVSFGSLVAIGIGIIMKSGWYGMRIQ